MEALIEKRKRVAPESLKTKRAREKLRKQWEQENRLFTEKALAETVDKIYKWIAANAVYRVPLKNKDISLFDENKNAANLSKRVQQVAKKIEFDMELIFPKN